MGGKGAQPNGTVSLYARAGLPARASPPRCQPTQLTLPQSRTLTALVRCRKQSRPLDQPARLSCCKQAMARRRTHSGGVLGEDKGQLVGQPGCSPPGLQDRAPQRAPAHQLHALGPGADLGCRLQLPGQLLQLLLVLLHQPRGRVRRWQLVLPGLSCAGAAWSLRVCC